VRNGIFMRTGCRRHSPRVCAVTAVYPATRISTLTRAGALMRTRASISALAVCAVLPTGCAIHYFDPETGTEHLWGFGHLKMKVSQPREGLQAVVRHTGTVGVAAGHLEQEGYTHAGVHWSERLDVVSEDTAIRFEWPDNDLFNVRVGSELPAIFASDKPKTVTSAGDQEIGG